MSQVLVPAGLISDSILLYENKHLNLDFKDNFGTLMTLMIDAVKEIALHATFNKTK